MISDLKPQWRKENNKDIFKIGNHNKLAVAEIAHGILVSY